MRILIISLSGAGDVLMATPMIKQIKKVFPKAKIECLVMQGEISKQVLEGNKSIDGVIYFNFLKRGFLKSLKMCLKLRKRNYDLSITTYPQARYHYSLVSYLIGAKRRIGFVYDSERFPLNNFFFTDTIKENFNEHVVKNNIGVLRLFRQTEENDNLSVEFNLDKKSLAFASRLFRKRKIKKAIAIHPGSGLTKNFYLKRWPEKNFVKLCKELKDRYFIFLIGGPEEKNLRERIIEASGIDRFRIFNLDENIQNTAAVIKKAGILITNDTLAGHVAAAIGVKVIALFGPTSWKNTGPFTKNKVIINKRPSSVEPYRHGSKGITKEQASYIRKICVDDVLKTI